MIALDTNALLRFMLRDDETHYQLIAPRIIEAKSNSCLITLLVCLETDWVLESGYEFTKHKRIEFFNTILSVKQFSVESVDVLKRAILLFQKCNADFSDCLISSQAKTLGATTVLTFDKKANNAGMDCLLLSNS